MTTTGETLDAVAEAGRGAALIGYLPVGFPTVEGSIEAMTALVESGVDIVEVGLPYSDPGMDGPVINGPPRRHWRAACARRTSSPPSPPSPRRAAPPSS